MKSKEARSQIQRILGEDDDSIFGPKTRGAFDRLAGAPGESEWPPEEEPVPVHSGTGPVHNVMASSFADPADVAAFRRCKATGKTDQQCFKVGDNGIGTPALGENGRGVDTTAPVPMCALPPDDWKPVKNPQGKKVIVRCEGKTVICELRDTMPRKANIQNGAGIDLNEAAWKVLGFKPPQMRRATWQWA